MSDCAVEEMAKTVEADAASIMEKLDIGNVAPSADSGEEKKKKKKKKRRRKKKKTGEAAAAEENASEQGNTEVVDIKEVMARKVKEKASAKKKKGRDPRLLAALKAKRERDAAGGAQRMSAKDFSRANYGAGHFCA